MLKWLSVTVRWAAVCALTLLVALCFILSAPLVVVGEWAQGRVSQINAGIWRWSTVALCIAVWSLVVWGLSACGQAVL